MIPYHLQTLPLLEEKGPGFLARVNSRQGICTELAWLTAGCHWEMHCVRDSSNQPRTKERQAVLPTAFAGGMQGSSEGHRRSAFVFLLFMEWPALCSRIHACTGTQTHCGHWPGRARVCCWLLLPLRGHLEEHGCDLREKSFLHTQEVFLLEGLRVKPIENHETFVKCLLFTPSIVEAFVDSLGDV